MPRRVRVIGICLLLAAVVGLSACSDPTAQTPTAPGESSDSILVGGTPLAFSPKVPDTPRVLLWMTRQPTAAELSQLDPSKVSFGVHLATDVALISGDAHSLEGLGFVGGFAPYKAEAKFSQGIRILLEGNSEKELTATLRFFEDVSLDEARNLVGDTLIDDTQASASFTLHKLVVRTHVAHLNDLAASDLVWQITRAQDVKNIAMSRKNRYAQHSVSADDLQPGGSGGYGLTGNGIWFGLWDSGLVRSSHEAFDGRVSGRDGGITDDHATHVAGTLIANGLAEPAARGAAYHAMLDSYDFNDDETEMAAVGQKLNLSNHSYGAVAGWNEVECGAITRCWGGLGQDMDVPGAEDPLFGKYGQTSAEWDDVVRDTDLLIFKSAGNDRDDTADSASYISCQDINTCGPTTYTTSHPNESDLVWDTIPANGVAKNVLTIGAVNDVPASVFNPDAVTPTDFSSFGPADDGRIKPDLVADGYRLYSSLATGNSAYGLMSGTSMSSPTAAGAAALVIEHAKTLLNGVQPKAATMKALLVHTARDVDNPGPDYRTGYGLMDVLAAAQALDEGIGLGTQVVEGVMTRTSLPINYVVAEPLAEGETFSCTLVWTDPAGAANLNGTDDGTPALVNDLDLSLHDENDSRTVYPFSLDPQNPDQAATATAKNGVDNVEKAVASGVSGAWRARVTRASTLDDGLAQPYSLVCSHAVVSEDAIQPVTGLPKLLPITADVGAASVDVALPVMNSGGGSLTVNLAAGTTNGVGVSFPDGPSLQNLAAGDEATGTVRLNTASLSAGRVDVEIRVSANDYKADWPISYHSVWIRLMMVDSPSPSLVFSPNPVTLLADEDGNQSAPAGVNVTNGGTGELNWQVTPDRSWVQIQGQDEGIGDGGFSVRINPDVAADLTPGHREANLVFAEASLGSVSLPFTAYVGSVYHKRVIDQTVPGYDSVPGSVQQQINVTKNVTVSDLIVCLTAESLLGGAIGAKLKAPGSAIHQWLIQPDGGFTAPFGRMCFGLDTEPTTSFNWANGLSSQGTWTLTVENYGIGVDAFAVSWELWILGNCQDLECDDGNLCTENSCQNGLGCTYTGGALGQDCDDNNPCTYDDICALDGCMGTPYECNDGLDCTEDACTGVQDGCDYTIQSGFCTIDGACVEENQVSPDNGCLICDPSQNLLVYTADVGASCDDGNQCTFNTECNDLGECLGESVDCSDELSCTEDTCDEEGGCLHPLAAGSCLIDDVCYSEGDTSPNLSCRICDASQPEEWSLATGTTCDDGNLCTENDTCTAGACAGQAKQCDDGLFCTANSCNQVNGECRFDPVAGYCLIDGACVAAGTTQPDNSCMACRPSVSNSEWSALPDTASCASDEASCTYDHCDGAGTCLHVLDAGTCLIDGQCYTDGASREEGSCQVCDASNSPYAFSQKPAGTTCADDGVTCTADTCDAGGTCRHNLTGDGCLIDGACYNQGQTDPITGCRICIGSNPLNWTPLADGSDCPTDNLTCTHDVCRLGVCEHEPLENYCLIDDGCYEDQQYEPGNLCRLCDLETSTTAWTARPGETCDDGTNCTSNDTCNEDGLCVGDGEASCDDGLACTAEVCSGDPGICENVIQEGYCVIDGACYTDGEWNPDNTCLECDAEADATEWTIHDANGCEDGNYCTVGDTCSNGVCVPGTQERICDDGVFCNGMEQCDEVLGCVDGEVPGLDDGIDCTTDLCNEFNESVSHIPNAAFCDNGLWCDGAESCNPDDAFADAQGCVAGEAPFLDDEIPCTTDYCDDLVDEVVHEPDHITCDDSLFCSGVEFCAPEDPNADLDGCIHVLPDELDDGIACTGYLCNEASHEIQFVPDDTRCDDSVFCNGTETCDPQSAQADDEGCVNTPLNLSDDIACTDDVCSEETQEIQHFENNDLCQDSTLCNGVELCLPTSSEADAQGCVPPDSTPTVDDNVSCTVDACDPVQGVTHTPDDSLCDNGLFCDGAERCDPDAAGADETTGCVPGVAPSLSDDIGCTVDACDEEQDQVTHHPNDGLCPQVGDPCVADNLCQPEDGGCVTQTAADGTFCDENNTGSSRCYNGNCVPLSEGSLCDYPLVIGLNDARWLDLNDFGTFHDGSAACLDGQSDGPELFVLARNLPAGRYEFSALARDSEIDLILAVVDACAEDGNDLACSQVVNDSGAGEDEVLLLGSEDAPFSGDLRLILESASADTAGEVDFELIALGDEPDGDEDGDEDGDISDGDITDDDDDITDDDDDNTDDDDDDADADGDTTDGDSGYVDLDDGGEEGCAGCDASSAAPFGGLLMFLALALLRRRGTRLV